MHRFPRRGPGKAMGGRASLWPATAAIVVSIVTVPAAGGSGGPGLSPDSAGRFGITAAIPISPASQTDPFYRQRFREGVSAYQEARYADAFRSLEIALFGLARDKAKLAECLVYAGLSAHRLKNDAKSREYVLRAGTLLETSGLEKPALKEADLALLERLLAGYKSNGKAPKPETEAPAWKGPDPGAPAKAAPETKAPATPPGKTAEKKKPAAAPQARKSPAQKPPVQTPPAETNRPRPAVASPPPASPLKSEPSPIAGLEKRLREDPGNAALTYELAGAYLEAGTPAKARQVLEPYLVKRPEDYGALFLLAKAEFRLRRFKPALAGFHALSSPRVQGELPPETALKTGIYLALCLFRQGDRANLPAAFALALSGAAPAVLDSAIASEGLTADWADLRKALGR